MCSCLAGPRRTAPAASGRRPVPCPRVCPGAVAFVMCLGGFLRAPCPLWLPGLVSPEGLASAQEHVSERRFWCRCPGLRGTSGRPQGWWPFLPVGAAGPPVPEQPTRASGSTPLSALGLRAPPQDAVGAGTRGRTVRGTWTGLCWAPADQGEAGPSGRPHQGLIRGGQGWPISGQASGSGGCWGQQVGSGAGRGACVSPGPAGSRWTQVEGGGRDGGSCVCGQAGAGVTGGGPPGD